MRTLDSYTTAEINELDNLMSKPEEERTEEEQAKITEFENAAQVASMVEQARAEGIASAANERVRQGQEAMTTALAEFCAMYSAALARLEAVNNG